MIPLIWVTLNSHSQRQKVEWWLPRTGRMGDGQLVCDGDGVSVQEDGGDGCTRMWMYLTSPTVHLKVPEVANSILWLFYKIFKEDSMGGDTSLPRDPPMENDWGWVFIFYANFDLIIGFFCRETKLTLLGHEGRQCGWRAPEPSLMHPGI